MTTYFKFPKADDSWMKDERNTPIWGREFKVFRAELDKILAQCPSIPKHFWLLPLEAAVYTQKNDKYYCAIPQNALPEGYPFKDEYLIIDAPFSDIQMLGYSKAHYCMDIYGR